ATALWKALQEGFVIPQTQVYKFYLADEAQASSTPSAELGHEPTVAYRFLHDRVQQAAYSLIPVEQKQATHLQIGQLLLSHTSVSEQEETLFEIVNQLNMAKSLIDRRAEKTQLAQLNLQAGQKARSATAYAAALEYFVTGIELLGENCWQAQYSLSLELYTSATEAAYLGGHFQQMADLAAIVLEHTRTLLDRVKVYEVEIQAAQAQAQPSKAIEIARQILRQLGVHFPEQPNEQDIGQAMGETLSLLAGRQPLDLIALPQMSDPKQLAIMEILASVMASAYVAAPTLLPLVMLEQVKLSLQYGNSLFSSDGYCGYGVILCGVAGDIETGYQFGQLALLVEEQLNTKKLKARTYGQVNCCISHWKEPLVNTLSYLREGYQSGLEVGDLEWGGICAVLYLMHAWFAGKELNDLSREGAAICAQFTQLKQETMSKQGAIFQQAILNLLGRSPHAWDFAGDAFDEAKHLPILLEAGNQTVLCYLNVSQLVLCYLFGQHERAIATAIKLESYLGAATGMSLIPVFHTYDSLAHLAVCSQVSEIEQQRILKRVTANQDKIKVWVSHAPANQLHKFDLVEAELHRVLGHTVEAIDHYDRAIAGAKTNGYLQEEALANELAARFYLNWGKEKVAAVYMQEAYYCYARWGARAKTDDLEIQYPNLLRPILQQAAQTLNPFETLTSIAAPKLSIHSSTTTNRSSGTSINTALDFAAILKASQSLSSTIQLDDLLHQLTQIILQNSGGDRCALILPNHAGTWQIEAIATPETTELCSALLDGNTNVPIKLVQYVKNTQEVIVIDDLKTELPILDEHLIQRQPKSILCLPVLNQGKLLGILYLTNQSTSGAFTNDCIVILNFLCTQAAIALENAQLYQQAQIYAQQLEQSQIQIVQSEKMVSLGNLVAGVAHEINNPIGFLNGSIDNAIEYVQDLLDYLTLYQQHHPATVQPVQNKADAIDLEFLCEDLPKLLDSMKGATDRIKDISTSLRTFSRADTEYKVNANLHDGLDSTLLILKYRLKANEYRPTIQVTQDYGDLPLVECFPGQLNQVFMNILANAIDVFDEAAQHLSFDDLAAKPQEITIQTAVLDDHNAVEIRIRDNGVGMTEEVKTRIFDHLFTTKGVGKGTGLGLAIARQIVTEQHSGSLHVQSELGQGTEFCIRLPMA
ncbi:GAF domain-containing protein, partial [Oculatella sp. LEGE 06141]|uniref:trifunctional serine/threonine-protein kinase/ATP-binding protein/sensor histidine kinase n=1 Tax=Oculatella sp. LEGE 06141 TaxID=1828648 RepID=UPI00187FA46A